MEMIDYVCIDIVLLFGIYWRGPDSESKTLRRPSRSSGLLTLRFKGSSFPKGKNAHPKVWQMEGWEWLRKDCSSFVVLCCLAFTL